MFLSESKKNLAAFVFLLLIYVSCRLFQTADNVVPKPFTPEEIKSEVPFSTKEPEVFQTEIVITANGTENKKYFLKIFCKISPYSNKFRHYENSHSIILRNLLFHYLNLH